MRCSTLLLPFILYYLQCVQSAKILGIFPVASYSHYILGSRIMKELSARGHDVTVLSPYYDTDAVGKFNSVELVGFRESMDELKKQLNMFELSGTSKLLSVFFMHYMSITVTDEVLENPSTQKLLKSNEKFDLIIIEQFACDSLRGFCHHFNAPCIMYSTIGTTYWTNVLVANPTNPSYIPELVLDHAGPMNFWKRLENTALALYTQVLFHLYFVPKQDALMHKYFPTAPPIMDLVHNTSLVLLNSHVSTAQAVPHVPNMIEIGGYHPQTPKKLPEDLQKYLDDAKQGVVYFSMGSNLQSSEIPIHKREAILNAFSKLKMEVLWKFEEDLPGKPNNVKISKWLPQQDILAHPNIKIFITHGGLLSTIEAIYHGVPVIGIPIYGDQATNMIHAVNGGFAEVVEYNTLTEEKLSSALNAIITNKKYAENAKLRSKIMHDRPTKPLDTAMYWIEYVIRHKGAPHLRSTAMDLTWYQYFLLDVMAVMALIPILSSVIFYIIIKKMFGKKVPKQSNSTKNKKSN